jgi:NAD(P)H-dependent flavin oxidoreductase YrpB (nitropropane dioxygenase family)
MKELKINRCKVQMYDSIDEMPIWRYHKFTQLMVLNSGIGSTMADIENKLRDILKYIQSDKAKAQKEVEKYWMGALRRAVVDGDIDYGSVMAGQSVGMADEVIPVKALIEELVTDASFELERIKGKLSVI